MRRLRKLIGVAISPVLAVTGFRFSKNFRWGVSGAHRLAYGAVDVCGANNAANLLADRWSWLPQR